MLKRKHFKSAVSAWFWFCENRHISPHDTIIQPLDILLCLDRLHENNTIDASHILVLKKYGFRGRSPDPALKKEKGAYRIWRQALQRLEVELVENRIVVK